LTAGTLAEQSGRGYSPPRHRPLDADRARPVAHLAAKSFTGAPRPLGFDEQGREVLTFLEGETTGSHKPWPPWTHAEDTLDQVARWMRAYHQ
jgi:hypothetical protein